jgi:4-azaleucine resistance transporter AzlC
MHKRGTLAGELGRGVFDIFPATVAAVPFALLVGAVGVQKGFSAAEMVAMSATVFAGASQFLVLELWEEPAPVALAIGATALINARHVLMSMSLARRLGAFSPVQRVLAMGFLVDESWAMAERRAAGPGLTPAYFAGASAFIYVAWVMGSWAGTLVGAVVAEPERYGFDFAFVAIFIGLIVALRRGRATDRVILAAAVAATMTHLVAPGALPVLAGALAGIAVAALWPADGGAEEGR